MDFRPLSNVLNYFGWYRGKDNFTQTPITYFNQVIQGKQEQYVSINGHEEHLFKTTPELYDVIMKKAYMYSNGVFKHYRMKGDKPEEVPNSPFVKLLENPNPLQGRNEWLIEEMIYTCLFGNSFVFGLRGYSMDTPKVLYNLPAGDMKVKPTGKIWKQSKLKDIIESYILENKDGSTETFKPDEIMHSRLSNPDNPIIGLSPLHSLQMPISNIRGAYGYRNVLIMERGAVGMISNEARDGDGGIPLSKDEKQKIEQQYAKDYGIGENQSKVIVTSSALKWTPFNYPTKDLMLFEEITADHKKIIDAYGMNEYLFAMDKGATFANLLEGKRMAYQDAIIPYADDFTYKLSQYFGMDVNNEWLCLDYSHVEALQKNEKEKTEILKNRAEAYRILVENGFTSTEAKKVTGFK
jgi:phage portal protein BeeE